VRSSFAEANVAERYAATEGVLAEVCEHGGGRRGREKKKKKGRGRRKESRAPFHSLLDKVYSNLVTLQLPRPISSYFGPPHD